jgi:hypothetical protein
MLLRSVVGQRRVEMELKRKREKKTDELKSQFFCRAHKQILIKTHRMTTGKLTKQQQKKG